MLVLEFRFTTINLKKIYMLGKLKYPAFVIKFIFFELYYLKGSTRPKFIDVLNSVLDNKNFLKENAAEIRINKKRLEKKAYAKAENEFKDYRDDFETMRIKLLNTKELLTHYKNALRGILNEKLLDDLNKDLKEALNNSNAEAEKFLNSNRE